MFKKFFNFIKNITTNIRNKIISLKGWILGFYTVMMKPFVKRLVAFINSIVAPVPAK